MKWVRFGPLAILCAGLGALSMLTLIWSVAPAEFGSSGGSLMRHPAREMRAAMSHLRASGSDQALNVLEATKPVLRRGPLEEEPFILAALADYNAENFADAARLLSIARVRNPRSIEVRFLAVDVFLGQGNIGAAARELDALFRLAPQQRMLAQEMLVLLASYPDTSAQTLGALRDDRVKSTLLVALARSGMGEADLLKAIRITRAAEFVTNEPATIDSIARPYVTSGDYLAAFRVWSALVGLETNSASLLRDPQFEEGLPGPFGWELLSSADGYARSDSPGLTAEIYGRRNALLARQLLVLEPGRYQIGIDVAEPSDQGEVVLQCVAGAELVRARTGKTGPILVDFSVDQPCEAQWLELRARASDPPLTDAFSINSVRIMEQNP